MKTTIITTLLTLLTSLASAFEATLEFAVYPTDAKIYFNGELRGTGKAKVELQRAILVEVKIEKEGYITFLKSYRYGKGSQFAMNEGKGSYERGENKYAITLEVDPNYLSPKEKENNLNRISYVTDSINKFFNVIINSKYNENEAWKIANQTLSDYFDDLENKKDESGNLKTAWQSQIIGDNKIRTRVIVKTNTEASLSFKIKIQSEYSDDKNSSVKDDEKFRDWDRLLLKYRQLIPDLNRRLTK